ncbi:MAG: hypothetical protein ACI93R_000517 [Flavobacteriales bacterium]|jgi:hypothetical protein
MKFQTLRLCLIIAVVSLFTACASVPPANPNDICDVFDEKPSWYKDAKKAEKRWNISLEIAMAVIYQESSFVAKAKPPRKKILWIFPGPRISSSYGYSQAKDETWADYKKRGGRRGADRDDFDDAIDFIAWYHNTSVKRLKIPKTDAKRLYLAYHEGQGGYSRGSYKKKAWLIKVANSVQARSRRYSKQLKSCEKRLNRSWWPF